MVTANFHAKSNFCTTLRISPIYGRLCGKSLEFDVRLHSTGRIALASLDAP